MNALLLATYTARIDIVQNQFWGLKQEVVY